MTAAPLRRARYRYVDFAAAAQPGFRNHVVPVDEVPALVERYGATECYTTIFMFSDEALLYLAEHRVNGRPSIAGFDGRVWAPFLPLDIDGHGGDGGLEEALALARDAYRLLVERWAVAPEAVHAYFSGAKGFHLLVDTRACGRVAPGRDLHRVFSRLRLAILRALPRTARSLFDLAIGDKVRLLRLPNTRHGVSGLYKIPLSEDELLVGSAADIRALAVAPRRLVRTTAAGLLPLAAVEAAPGLETRFASARNAVRRARGAHPYRLGPSPAAPAGALCAARRAMWEGQVLPGNRNNVAIRLASAFRLAGYREPETSALLLAWNRDRRIGLPEREILAVVRSAHARPFPYLYGCHDEVIRGYCPFVGRLLECEDYRQRGVRAGSEA